MDTRLPPHESVHTPAAAHPPARPHALERVKDRVHLVHLHSALSTRTVPVKPGARCISRNPEPVLPRGVPCR